MAIEKIKVVNKVGRLEKLDDVIDVCCKCGYFQPEPAMNYLQNVKGFTSLNEENPYAASLQKLTDILTASNHAPARVNIDGFEMTRPQINHYIMQLIDRVGSLQEKRGELLQSIEQAKHAIEQFSHFFGLDIRLNEVFGSKFIKVRFGRIPAESFERLQQYHDNPYVLFFPCSSDRFYYWGMYVSPADKIVDVDRIFASLYFERLRIPDAVGTPEEASAELQQRVEKEKAELKELDDSISAYWDKELDYSYKVYTYLDLLNTKFELRKYAAKYNDTFMYTGWIPANRARDFERRLSEIDEIEYEVENPDSSQKVVTPTKLKNSRFSKPYEFYVDMFGVPAYNEVDPTLFVGITYTVIFGIMFADVGQGLLLALIGWLMWKLKKMQLGPILVRCDISSALFGVVFGSVFGFEHVLDPLYRLVGFEEKPIEVLDPNMIMYIIYAAIGIGVVLILVAMFINIYSCLKRKDWENALFSPNGAAGFLFYGSTVFGLILLLMLHINIYNVFTIVLCIALPLVLMFFKEFLGNRLKGDTHWRPDRWSDYIMQNFFEVFEYILSYISNTISFLRIGAFVLVHTGMMMVVFQLAELTPPAVSVIVIILGNLFVMALEALLVSIQALRLEFYEMFSRFFAGSGRPFEPIDLTKEKQH